MRWDPTVGRAALWGLGSAIAAGLAVLLASATDLAERTMVMPVAIEVCFIVAAIAYVRLRLRSSIRASRAASDRRLAAAERRLDGRIHDLGSWLPQAAATAATYGDLAYPLPIGNSWAIGWDVAGVLAREIMLGRPNVVVELGSGGSSLLIGESLRRLGAGHLYTLDHEREYAARTRRQLEALELTDWVTVLDAPLVDQEVRGARYAWYRLPPEILALPAIDALIVDGPPHAVDPAGLPRYPALPVLADRLSGSAFVFVDDHGRPAERQMVQRWVAEEPGWVADAIRTSTGTAILRRAAPAAAAS